MKRMVEELEQEMSAITLVYIFIYLIHNWTLGSITT